MSVSPSRSSALQSIFGVSKPLIGDIHLLPLPGTPRYRGEPLSVIVERACADAEAFAAGGMDGVMVENHGDIPFLKPHEIGPEIVAAMSVLADAVRRHVDVPLGVNLLANGAVGALRFRRQIGADDVAIFADVHVKHGSHAIVDDRPVSEQASDAEFYDADVAIATGNRTGDAVPEGEIAAIRGGTRLPIIAGSGITPQNAPKLLPLLDGAIVGSSLKRDGVWWNPVERARVEALVATVKRLREAD